MVLRRIAAIANRTSGLVENCTKSYFMEHLSFVVIQNMTQKCCGFYKSHSTVLPKNLFYGTPLGLSLASLFPQTHIMLLGC